MYGEKMKKLPVLLILLSLALRACALDFNPPPLSMTPGPVQPTQPPVIVMATSTPLPATQTTVPPTATLPASSETPLPTSTPEPTATQPPVTDLNAEQLRNSTYNLQATDHQLRTITLVNGSYASGPDLAEPGYIAVNLGEQIAFGDLNGDGQKDAAIITGENFGGTGEFISVQAVLNQGGYPIPDLAGALIDDRAQVQAVTIQDGEIVVNATIHGPGEPACCAATLSTRAYQLIAGSLRMTRLTSTTPNAPERVITITSPLNGTEIDGPFIIQGNVTVSPFENNLVYSIFTDQDPQPVEQSAFLVGGDGLGGPGTFELPLDPSKFNYKGTVRIVISDLSPVDGSTLALTTIVLVFK
jgi:hypothetical protein